MDYLLAQADKPYYVFLLNKKKKEKKKKKKKKKDKQIKTSMLGDTIRNASAEKYDSVVDKIWDYKLLREECYTAPSCMYFSPN